MKRKILIVTLVMMVMVCALAVPALAAGKTQGKTLPRTGY